MQEVICRFVLINFCVNPISASYYLAKLCRSDMNSTMYLSHEWSFEPMHLQLWTLDYSYPKSNPFIA